MKNIYKEHYRIICERGLITPTTTSHEFIIKLDEEYHECLNEYADDLHMNKRFPSREFIQESVDVMMVIANMLTHLGLNVEKEIRTNIETQKQRCAVQVK